MISSFLVQGDEFLADDLLTGRAEDPVDEGLAQGVRGTLGQKVEGAGDGVGAVEADRAGGDAFKELVAYAADGVGAAADLGELAAQLLSQLKGDVALVVEGTEDIVADFEIAGNSVKISMRIFLSKIHSKISCGV